MRHASCWPRRPLATEQPPAPPTGMAPPRARPQPLARPLPDLVPPSLPIAPCPDHAPDSNPAPLPGSGHAPLLSVPPRTAHFRFSPAPLDVSRKAPKSSERSCFPASRPERARKLRAGCSGESRPGPLLPLLPRSGQGSGRVPRAQVSDPRGAGGRWAGSRTAGAQEAWPRRGAAGGGGSTQCPLVAAVAPLPSSPRAESDRREALVPRPCGLGCACSTSWATGHTWSPRQRPVRQRDTNERDLGAGRPNPRSGRWPVPGARHQPAARVEAPGLSPGSGWWQRPSHTVGDRLSLPHSPPQCSSSFLQRWGPSEQAGCGQWALLTLKINKSYFTSKNRFMWK